MRIPGAKVPTRFLDAAMKPGVLGRWRMAVRRNLPTDMQDGGIRVALNIDHRSRFECGHHADLGEGQREDEYRSGGSTAIPDGEDAWNRPASQKRWTAMAYAMQFPTRGGSERFAHRACDSTAWKA
jgi:hypothetical protein